MVICKTRYMSHPQDSINHTKPTYVCELHKTLNGPKQGPKVWYAKMK